MISFKTVGTKSFANVKSNFFNFRKVNFSHLLFNFQFKPNVDVPVLINSVKISVFVEFEGRIVIAKNLTPIYLSDFANKLYSGFYAMDVFQLVMDIGHITHHSVSILVETSSSDLLNVSVTALNMRISPDYLIIYSRSNSQNIEIENIRSLVTMDNHIGLFIETKTFTDYISPQTVFSGIPFHKNLELPLIPLVFFPNPTVDKLVAKFDVSDTLDYAYSSYYFNRKLYNLSLPYYHNERSSYEITQSELTKQIKNKIIEV